MHNLYLVAPDLAAERAELIGRGVAVGAIRHKGPVESWAGAWSSRNAAITARTDHEHLETKGTRSWVCPGSKARWVLGLSDAS
jgi:hypothetical protein